METKNFYTVIDRIILLLSVVLGFAMGMVTQTFKHREVMKSYEVLQTQGRELHEDLGKARRGRR